MLSYAVVQQTRELGIRAALGAQQRALVRMVVTSGLTTAFAGAATGVVARGVAGFACRHGQQVTSIDRRAGLSRICFLILLHSRSLLPSSKLQDTRIHKCSAVNEFMTASSARAAPAWATHCGLHRRRHRR